VTESSDAVPGVDTKALTAFMDTKALGRGPITGIRPLSGGTQNILIRFDRSQRSYVLRRGPLHLTEHNNNSILREIKLLTTLAGTPVPHARLIVGCAQDAVLGAAFYLMEEIDGVNATMKLSAAHATDSATRHQMGLAAVDALAAVAQLDPDALGLSDLGKAEGFLDRQVPLWTRRLESYERFAGYQRASFPDVTGIANWLTAHQPRQRPARILHGDYHLANLIFDREGPAVRAIVDWEMVTVGDALLDLGWLLASWPGNGGAEIGGRLARAGGLPTRDDVIERYAASEPDGLEAIDWYEVLACFKFAVVVEATYARACAGRVSPKIGDRLHAMALSLVGRAQDLIG
jgi:aminoglycoside phosphotransferase (APT) family kinase protein